LASELDAAIAPWGTPGQVFDRLEGRWALARSIEGKDPIRMQGVARFTRAGPRQLLYREEGSVTLADGRSLQAHREYIFERTADGFEVHFREEPPRLFHRIRLARLADALAGAAPHLCAPDHYDSSYRFLADGRFEIRHAVQGPRKDYLSCTGFSRLG